MYRQSKILRQIYLLDASFGYFSLCTLQLNWLLMCSSHRVENNRICKSHDSAKRAQSSRGRRGGPIKCSAVDQNINENNQKYVNNTKVRGNDLFTSQVDDDEMCSSTFKRSAYQFPQINRSLVYRAPR